MSNIHDKYLQTDILRTKTGKSVHRYTDELKVKIFGTEVSYPCLGVSTSCYIVQFYSGCRLNLIKGNFNVSQVTVDG